MYAFCVIQDLTDREEEREEEGRGRKGMGRVWEGERCDGRPREKCVERERDREIDTARKRLFSGNVTSFIHSRGSSCFYFRFQKEIEACWYRNWPS